MTPAQSSQATNPESAARFVAEASRVLAKSFDLSFTLPRVAQLAAAHLADCCIIEIVAHDGTARVAAVASRRGGAVEDTTLRGALPQCPSDGSSLLLDSLPGSWWSDAGFAPAVIEPISAGGTRVGIVALAIEPPPGDAPSQGVDLELARELTGRLAVAIDNARRFMRERRVARSFQTALLPTSFPALAGRTFHAAYAPATDEAEVGGDWYDAFDLPDGRIAMSIGDVAGHGLEAAVVMGEVRQTFRVAAMENRDPGAVLDMANRLLLLRPQPTMVTAIFGTYDGRTFEYASAGHPPPILGTPEGSVEQLPIGGIPLGVDGTQGRPSWTVTIPPGSMLVLYTDGLIESQHDVVDGEQALLAAVRDEMSDRRADSAGSIRERVLGDRRNVDDVAILTFAVEEAPMPEVDVRFSAAPVAARLVRQSMCRFATDAGLTEEQNFALNVAVGEAVNNVIEHAYLRAPGSFRVCARREDRKIICSVEDEGAWRRARREGRGHGLAIIRSLMDGVEVNLTQKGTVVKMVYDLDGSGQEKRRSAAGGR